ncbi:MAG: glutamate 5-kinase [Paracoccaceae bacterium]|jgi:glutamate 5-kinase|nr:glutamate 5-kinase [Paracoccaceae bacterium]MDG1372814.1 glutamate 5-kinase [Paracoccaceae bacterium]MDG1970617.1 glutamate 5-kinase [Paracoccaceae bacterium]
MDALTSAQRIKTARRAVVKIGSALLVDAETGALRSDWLTGLAKDVAELRGRGAEVLIVSSGSIALGRRVLKLPAGPLPVEQSQAAAAVGQIRLARAYEQALEVHDLTTAQVLVTLEDSRDRRRYLNGRSTLNTLLSLGAIPIVNENDTIATDEIRFGDNDRLAAQVASMAGADALVLLSDVDGLYTANPRVDPSAYLIPEVAELTPEIEAMAGDAGTEGAKGGMRTKIMAAKAATKAGCAMAITRGDCLRPLQALANGAAATWFNASNSPQAARKQWIAGMRPEGKLIVDDGAAKALRSGKSLLPAGVRGVEGGFQRGDPVTIETPSGEIVAVALSGYVSDEARQIAGLRSDQIEAALGHPGRTAMAHRDDMVLWN